jgi:hypothetical protein
MGPTRVRVLSAQQLLNKSLAFRDVFSKTPLSYLRIDPRFLGLLIFCAALAATLQIHQ